MFDLFGSVGQKNQRRKY